MHLENLHAQILSALLHSCSFMMNYRRNNWMDILSSCYMDCSVTLYMYFPVCLRI
jgi:hypothetical protein